MVFSANMDAPLFHSNCSRLRHFVRKVGCSNTRCNVVAYRHIVFYVWQGRFAFPLTCHGLQRYISTEVETRRSSHVEEDTATKLIRNVGMIAHIDAGKTTTTERMLYFAHRTYHIGEVDRGNTVTDYLPEERERGISIVSAAACLSWNQHTIHLVDTPGHVDFTMEVERCLAVLDGAVTILDGTKGVQAQTRTVWHQADRYNLPRLVFVNKLDRENADFQLSLSSLCSQLASTVRYVPIHWPVSVQSLAKPGENPSPDRKEAKSARRSAGTHFMGLIDLVTMKFLDWSQCTSPDALPQTSDLLHKLHHSGPVSTSNFSSEFMQTVLDARIRLLAELAEVDEELADHFLAVDHPEHLMPSELIQSALKRATHRGQIIPVLVGSSRQNIGIQPLLDAIVDYLPNPTNHKAPAPVQRLIHQVWSMYSHSRPPTGFDLPVADSAQPPVLLVFKVCFDPHRGPLSLVRIYSGSVKKGSLLTNWSLNRTVPITEKVLGVFQMTGDQRESVDCATTGSIVALAGLESTHSGDLLGPVRRTSTSNKDSSIDQNSSEEEDHDVWISSLPELNKCEPVVYAALEPGSLSAVRPLEYALACMQREDPSFTARLDAETGQWIVGGMGDLHLEVILSRLQREYKVDVRNGPLLIAYKECPLVRSKQQQQQTIRTPAFQGYGRVTGSVDGSEKVAFAIVSVEASEYPKPQIHFDRSWLGHVEQTGKNEIGSPHGRLQHNIREVCLSTLEMAGPLMRSPVVNVDLRLHRVACESLSRLPQSIADVDVSQLPTLTRLPSSNSALASFITLLRSAVAAAVTDGVRKIPEWRIMEPMMSVELRVPTHSDNQSDSLSRFLGDLSARRAEILAVDSADSADPSTSTSEACHVIQALAPLSELVGYSATARSISSGRAEVHMKLAEYRPVSQEYQAQLLNRLQWRAPVD
ncbi:putative translation elongation factor G [Opisthorchis viverrini]|uniref:Putative translation elongation factor G n=1 Tax=Opisthorchis viverrini TaxID=6198 RepID=A0A1S8WZV8_OPIVI|nr:putative translation elongation factor G [Opisthorchis viverrini]